MYTRGICNIEEYRLAEFKLAEYCHTQLKAAKGNRTRDMPSCAKCFLSSSVGCGLAAFFASHFFMSSTACAFSGGFARLPLLKFNFDWDLELSPPLPTLLFSSCALFTSTRAPAIPVCEAATESALSVSERAPTLEMTLETLSMPSSTLSVRKRLLLEIEVEAEAGADVHVASVVGQVGFWAITRQLESGGNA